jgi:hypothetical protein
MKTVFWQGKQFLTGGDKTQKHKKMSKTDVVFFKNPSTLGKIFDFCISLGKDAAHVSLSVSMLLND